MTADSSVLTNGSDLLGWVSPHPLWQLSDFLGRFWELSRVPGCAPKSSLPGLLLLSLCLSQAGHIICSAPCSKSRKSAIRGFKIESYFLKNFLKNILLLTKLIGVIHFLSSKLTNCKRIIFWYHNFVQHKNNALCDILIGRKIFLAYFCTNALGHENFYL